jgi:hypothetical protein
MTETQAGTASADTEQDSGDGFVAEHGGAGDSVVAGSGAGTSGGKDPGAVGRATVPGEPNTGGSSKFTRAPGMVPPPDSLTVPVQSPSVTSGKASVSGPPASGLPIAGMPGAPVSGVPVSGVPVSGVPASGVPAIGSASASGVARASARVPGTTGSGGATTGVFGLRTAPASAPGASGSGVSGSARVTEAVRAARKTVSAAVGRGPRRARLHVKRIDPWSVMKFAFAVSFVLFVVVIVATSVLYLALDAMGVFKSVNKTLTDMIGATGGTDGGGSFKITAKGVIGGAALLGLVNVVLFTALATLGAFIYNVCADLVGGIELTLAEKE